MRFVFICIEYIDVDDQTAKADSGQNEEGM